jgi:hypothetical protein
VEDASLVQPRGWAVIDAIGVSRISAAMDMPALTPRRPANSRLLQRPLLWRGGHELSIPDDLLRRSKIAGIRFLYRYLNRDVVLRRSKPPGPPIIFPLL